MGAQVRSGPNWLEVRRGTWPLKALTLDCNHIPDAAMTLAVMALYADGPTRLTNIASWRVKETDRIAAMATELRKLGATVQAGDDFIEVQPPATWRDADVHTYDDHRMAMCLSLAAFNPLAPAPGRAIVRVRDPGCVAKTFPDYFEALLDVAGAPETDIPVITVDGPSASGKGTLADRVAAALGYHLLDSGALYRAAALAAHRDGIDLADEAAVARVAALLDLRFEGDRIWLRGEEVSQTLRTEDTGTLASRTSAHPRVREALHALQLAFRRAPGLVADGRDMGTVIFPDAALKVFLVASAEQRAQRRLKQLISKGIQANIDSLRADLEARDARDKNRASAPLKPAEDAQLLDNSELSIDQSVDKVLGWWAQRRPFDDA
jgi:3-phosphoshikimate 1-carboxyvinyltransferase